MPDNPLFKKLRLLPDQRVLILHAPGGYLASLGEFPPGTIVETEIKGQFDLVHAFYTHAQPLEEQIDDIKSALIKERILWISYPKQSAKQETDLNRDILREAMIASDLKAVSMVSINDIWSAMRFKQI